MAIKALSGEIKNLAESTHTSGTTGNNAVAQGHIKSKQVYSFRIGNNPVVFESKSLVGISDGDSIICAGSEENGVLKALKIKNETTGVTYGGSIILAFISTLLVFGVALMGAVMSMVLGVPLFILGFWVFYKSFQLFKSNKALLAFSVK